MQHNTTDETNGVTAVDYLRDDRVLTLNESDCDDVNLHCPNCAEVLAHLSFEPGGGVRGAEIVCPECESALFDTSIVAVPAKSKYAGDVDLKGLRTVVIDYLKGSKHGTGVLGEGDWEWIDYGEYRRGK